MNEKETKSRDLVFLAIDNERKYQDERWEKPQHFHSNTEYAVYIDHYLKQIFHRASTEDGEGGTLEPMAKIAALAVAAMEENGIWVRHRNQYEPANKPPRIIIRPGVEPQYE